MLKKLLILMAMIMLVSFAGCGKDDESSKSKDGDNDPQFVERETEDMVDCSWFRWDAGDSLNMQAIFLKHSDENAIFECTVDKGHFVFWRGYNDNEKQHIEFFKSLVLKSGDGVPFPVWPVLPDEKAPEFDYRYRLLNEDGFSWWPYEIGPYPGPSRDREIKQAFVEIVLKIDNNIAGYAVVEIFETYQPDTNYSYFLARVLKSALFPKIDSEYQNVTQEYVKTVIERIKNK